MSKSLDSEPLLTASVLDTIPECLKRTLGEPIGENIRRQSILISSNNLANRFILARWGIRPSQRKKYRHLFDRIRKECRVIFRNYHNRGRLQWKYNEVFHTFGVFKYEIRGNLILGFVKIQSHEEWKLTIRSCKQSI